MDFEPLRVVIDTNVMVAAFRSPRGASAAILRAVRAGQVLMVCNPPLFLEYEQVLKRPLHLTAAGVTEAEIDEALDVLAGLLIPAPKSRTERPRLPDPDDEMVLEAAEFGAPDAIVTFETRTFAEAGRILQIAILTPGQFVARLKS